MSFIVFFKGNEMHWSSRTCRISDSDNSLPGWMSQCGIYCQQMRGGDVWLSVMVLNKMAWNLSKVISC